MKLGNIFMAGVFVTLGAAPALAQDPNAQPPQSSYSRTTTITEKTVTVSGPVVRYAPGKTIVITRSGKEVTYPLSPTVSVPPDVIVGKTYTLYTSGSGPKTVVTRIVTSPSTSTYSSSPETESAQPLLGDDKDLSVVGVVRSYESNKTITIEQPDGSTLTYTIGSNSDVPRDIQVGKRVTIYTTNSGATTTTEKPVVTRVVVVPR